MNPNVLKAISPQRFSRYLQASHGDEQKALALYQLNAELGASFWVDLMWLEITLRNSINAELSASFTDHWFQAPAFTDRLGDVPRKFLAQSVEASTHSSASASGYAAGKIIANLTFGFWTGLVSKHYTHSLWIPSLRKMFDISSAPDRAAIHQALESARRLRNRIAHHEPIFHLNLMSLNSSIAGLLTALNPTVASLVKSGSKTSTLLGQHV